MGRVDTPRRKGKTGSVMTIHIGQKHKGVAAETQGEQSLLREKDDPRNSLD